MFRGIRMIYIVPVWQRRVVIHCLDSSSIVNIVVIIARVQVARSDALQEYLLVPVNLCERQPQDDGDYKYSCVLSIDHVLISVDGESLFLLAVSRKCR